jgi:ribosome-associated toxin RatA of RatAB toxin-antitoxin module
LPFHAEQMFVLVSDIESYPQYMRGCIGSEVLRREQNLVEARLDLAQSGIAHSFTTRNHSQAPHSIELELIDGPFDHFAGEWQFRQLGDAASKISLQLEFRMNSRLLSVAARRLFEGVTLELVDAVTQRAGHLYGLPEGVN